MTYVRSNASFFEIWKRSLTVWMFLISFPYRLAVSHFHGLFFRYLTRSVSFFLLWFSIWGRGTQLSRNVMGKKWNRIVGLKRIFCFLSCLNCLLSWDKNLINHDFHRRRLREVKFKLAVSTPQHGVTNYHVKKLHGRLVQDGYGATWSNSSW